MSFRAPELVVTNNCFKCDSNFSFWKGRFRYYCRCCGYNFCNDCLQNNCALPRIGIFKEVRICDACYHKYNNSERKDDENDTESDDIFFDSALSPRLGLPEDIDDLFENINLDEVLDGIEEENARYLPVNEDIIPPESEKYTQCSSGLNGCIDEEMKSNIFTVHPKTKELVDDRQLEMALSLSRIENKFVNYITCNNTEMSEEEQIDFALRLSALEEKAKTIVSRLDVPQIQSKNLDDDDDLSLALAISKIESEDAQSSKEERKTNENITKSPQVQCPICFEERLEYALIACGHVVCGDCKPKLEECPICRAVIRGAIRVYITN